MTVRVRFAVTVAVLVGLSTSIFMAMSGRAEARPQYTAGYACMYTKHVSPGATSAENVYVDPGNGWTEGDWETEFQLYNDVTNEWGNWLGVDIWGDVLPVACCDAGCESENVRIWAFSTFEIDTEIFTRAKWRIIIKNQYPGRTCSENEPVYSSPAIDVTSPIQDTRSAECQSRDVYAEDEFLVTVSHY